MTKAIQLYFLFYKPLPKRRKKERKVIWEHSSGLRLLEPNEFAGINVCLGCYLRGLCDDDDCGRKIGRLFNNKKR